MPEGFQYTAGSAGAQQHYSRAFPSLDAVYEDWDRVYVRVEDWEGVGTAGGTALQFARGDLAGCFRVPTFPGSVYSLLWRPLEGPVELRIYLDNEQRTAHGPHVVFGPVDIVSPAPHICRTTATSGWLVVEDPAFTMRGMRGRRSRAILRPTRTILDRLRLYLDNRHLWRDSGVWTHVRPGVIVICGMPPADWQNVRHLLPMLPVPPA
jgi:hypothetical protein